MNTLVAVRLPNEIIEELEKTVKAEGRLSSQEIIREAVSDYLKKRKREEALRELQQFAGILAGKTTPLTRQERRAIFEEINRELEAKERTKFSKR